MLLREIVAEMARLSEDSHKWSGPESDDPLSEWHQYIEHQGNRLEFHCSELLGEDSRQDRQHLISVVALALTAINMCDQQQNKSIPDDLCTKCKKQTAQVNDGADHMGDLVCADCWTSDILPAKSTSRSFDLPSYE